MIKRLKPLYQLYNLFQYRRLRHNIPLYKKYGIKKKYWQNISAADFKDLPERENTYDRMDSRKHLPQHPGFADIKNDGHRESVKDWSQNGYAILRNFFSRDRIDEINAEVDRLLDRKKIKFSHGGDRLMFAYRKSGLLAGVGNDGRLVNILQLLLDREVSLFQSINFKTGSQQRTHSDSIHMTTYPLGNLIAVWIALEDIGPEQGPLHYYPGSHKLPYITKPDYDASGNRFFLGKQGYGSYEDKIQKIIDREKLKKKVFTAGKGDLLIWHANLLHGGEPMRDLSLSRKSMVLHYFAKDAICYHEITQRPALMNLK